jgi:hypothetical protein
MSAQQVAEQVEEIILSSTEAFGNEIEDLQGVIYNRLLGVLKNLEIDQDGYIKQSANNRRTLYDAENLINEILPGESLPRLVSEVIAVIPEIDALNIEYFQGISASFKSNRAFINSLQSKTIDQIESTLLQDGLTAAIKNPLSDILNLNINTGGNFSGFLQQVRDFVEGNDELDGWTMSYSRTYLRDTLFNYSRAYQQSVTADLNLVYYSYSGGLMDKSREFCIERSGNFYHESEIKAWADEDWQGKRQGTTESSIFIYCGGYNCNHSLVPVHESIVPKEVIDRVLELAQ